MHDLMSLLDQLLAIPGMLLELLILILLVWIPIASELWMLRLYLFFSLSSTAAMLVLQHIQSTTLLEYATVLQVCLIIGHVLLVLVAVELMSALINDSKRSIAQFYALAIAAFLLSVISDLRFPIGLTLGQIMILSMKSLALVGFILAFTLAFTKRYRWPYSGLAFGLAVMMLLNFIAVLARNWSAGHSWQYYGTIRYAFPLASDTGYFLWLRSVIVHKKPPEHTPIETIIKWKAMIRSYHDAIKDLLHR